MSVFKHKDSLFKRKIKNEDYWRKKEYLFDLDLPRRVYKNKGKKILFIVDRVHNEDINSKILLSNTQGRVLNNIVEKIKQNAKKDNFSEYAAINFHCFRINNLNSRDKSQALDCFKDRILKFIETYNPDIIVFLGREAIKEIDKSYDSSYHMGNIKKFEYNNKNYRYIASLSLDIIATTDKEKYLDYPNLIGMVYFHIETALNGKNFYNIQKKVDKVPRTLVDTMDKFNLFFEKLKKSSIVGIDTEGINLSIQKNKMLSVQFCLDGKESYFIPLFHPQSPFDTTEIRSIIEKLKYYFEMCNSKHHVYQNAKYDLKQFYYQFKLKFYNHKVYDTIAGEFCLDENRKFIKNVNYVNGPYRLDTLELKYGYKRDTGVVGKTDRDNLINKKIEDFFEYGLVDSITIYFICECQKQESERRGTLSYENFEKCVTTLNGNQILSFAEMEYNGTKIDQTYLLELNLKNSLFNSKLRSIEDKFKTSKNARKANEILLKERGVPENSGTLFGNSSQWIFQINKPYHKHVLYHNVMGLESQFGKNGLISTNEKFKSNHSGVKEVDLLNEYDKNNKLKNTFVRGLIKIIEKDSDFLVDGRIRPEYKFSDIITGRGGCSNPNLQQIPSRGDLAKIIKRMFIAEKYNILMDVDYSAHEIRIWGNSSQDKKLCSAFSRGLELRRKLRLTDKSKRKKIKEKLITEGDVHRTNFKFFFNRFPKDKDERRSIKFVIFGVIYGKGIKSLASDISNKNKIKDLQKEVKLLKKEIKKRERKAA